MKQPHREGIYAAAERFVDAALRADGSLFTPSRAIWSAERAEDVYQRFNMQPDETGRSFTQKLQDQLEGASPASYQLFGECVYVTHLVASDIKGGTKRRLIEEILHWSPDPVEIPPELAATLDEGLAATSLAFKTLRPFQLWFLIEFVRKWKSLPQADRDAALNDPWKFKEILNETPIDKGYAQREALKHLVFPGVFEDIVSREHKRMIAAAFVDLVTQPTDDVDRQIVQIRERITEREGRPFSFYDPQIRALWSSDAGSPEKWDEFFRWGKLLWERDDFDATERTYKLQIAEALTRAREQLLVSDSGWLDSLRQGLQHKDNNLANWQLVQPFLQWVESRPSDAEQALRAIWAPDESFTGRTNSLLDKLPDEVSGARFFPVLSLLLMAVDPLAFPPFRATPLKKGFELTDYPPQAPGTDFGRRYRHALGFFEKIQQEAKQRGLELRDALDAQSLLWWLTNAPPPTDWPDDQKRAFLEWRGEEGGVPLVEAEDSAEVPKPGLDSLAARLYLPEEFLLDTLELLRDKKQAIFYGPPGTGKTFVARELIKHLVADRSQFEIVQFHPSYSYEDFVQGYRPMDKDGQLIYELRAGPLMRLAERATAVPDREFFLLIDEINRGNLPRIFGELLYLLEYRADEVTLMYEGEGLFALPPNLFILGTMNTADRSIGLVDAALRRRFHFVGLFPEKEPLNGLLGRWLEDNHPEMAYVARIVDRLNARLRQTLGRHLQIGHSHFMKSVLNEEVLGRIWENDVMPFLEDQFYGHDQELEQYQLKRVREEKDADDSTEGASAGADEALLG